MAWLQELQEYVDSGTYNLRLFEGRLISPVIARMILSAYYSLGTGALHFQRGSRP